MDHVELIKRLCTRFQERVVACNLKGKRRDDEAIAYFVGAAMSLSLTSQANLAEAVSGWTSMILAMRGYKAIEAEVVEG